MNPINPVCRPATENEINYGEAKWCAKCTSECDSKGKDELVMCDYFKTNDNDRIVLGCPSLMPHALPGGLDSVALAEEGTPMPEPKDFAAKAKLHLVHAMTKHPYFADKIYFSSNEFDTQGYKLCEARNRFKYEIENNMVHASTVLECEICEAMFAAESGTNGEAISECYDAIAVLMRMIMFFEGTQKLGNPQTKGFHAEMNRGEIGEMIGREATREKSSQVGNKAAMRDACANIAEYAKAASCHTDDSHLLGYLYQIERWAESAIAAPPRNCDVGKPEEQQDRFREFCRRHFDARECGLGRSVAKCPAYQGGKNPDCSLWWAQMPYEEGGAK